MGNPLQFGSYNLFILFGSESDLNMTTDSWFMYTAYIYVYITLVNPCENHNVPCIWLQVHDLEQLEFIAAGTPGD